MDSEPIEGFLCPMCKTDLRSPDQLTQHFESQHNQDQDVLRSIKDMFGKAKKRILNVDECGDLRDTFERTLKSDFGAPSAPQTLGATRSQSDYYKSVRSLTQEKYAAETNKLLIRLDKLVANMPADQALRKAYEQEIVPWFDGSLVKMCPGCAKAFNITRRQHHCRLCGAILCNACSSFFDLNVARCIIDPSLSVDKLKTDTDPMKNGLRLCEHCYKLIEMRKQLQDSRNSKTVLVTGYEQMRSIMEQTLPAMAMYLKMVNSLKEGETTYHLSDVSILKSKIARNVEGIDSLSKQIVALQISPPGSQTNRLQKAIRQAAAIFIKDELCTLPPVPTEAEINEIRRANSEMAERRIEQERKRTELNMLKRQTYEDQGSSSTSRGVAARDGWTVVQTESAPDAQEEDPLLEQINRIREYIRQAREEMRFEEVAILEKNLKELKEEYQNQSSHSEK